MLPIEIIKIIVWYIPYDDYNNNNCWYNVVYVLLGRTRLYNTGCIFDMFVLKRNNITKKTEEFVLPGSTTFHRRGDKPAYVQYNEHRRIIEERYYEKGILHRGTQEHRLPAIIRYYDDGTLFEERYFQHGKELYNNTSNNYNPISTMYFDDGTRSQDVYYYKDYYEINVSRVIHVCHNDRFTKISNYQRVESDKYPILPLNTRTCFQISTLGKCGPNKPINEIGPISKITVYEIVQSGGNIKQIIDMINDRENVN